MTDATLLLRQVNPQFCSNGRPSYQVFRLTDSDKGLLSVYDGDLITAADAWKHWTEVAKKKSVGAVAVSVAECVAEDLTPRSDPEPFPSHAVIDCTPHSESEYRVKRLVLFNYATVRGWLHTATPDA